MKLFDLIPAEMAEALCHLVDAKGIERGESDRLWRMIYELESGQPD
jgi:hypothetical protein